MDILFSKDKVSYTHEDIEKLCKLVCEDKNIDYKYYNMRFLEYKRDSNDAIYYHLGNGKEKYSYSLMIRYFGKHKADYMGYLAKGEKAKEGYIPEWFSAEGELLYRFK